MAQTVAELACTLNRRNSGFGKFPPLLLMTDSKRLPDPSDLIPRLPKGSGVIVRHFSRQKKLETINKIKKLCHKHKVKLLVSDDIRLAVKERLDGVHCSENFTKKIAGCGQLKKPYPNFLITAACHSKASALRAQVIKSDAILVSPIFTTESHRNVRTKGCSGLENLMKNATLKGYALGGINKKTARRLLKTSICGFAGIGNLV